ncbi:MAG: hypothetical protein RQ767_01210 [Thermovirgaceae bacterium]|nr:hypothetical protein [Thermovirgaceae bacterium]
MVKSPLRIDAGRYMVPFQHFGDPPGQFRISGSRIDDRICLVREAVIIVKPGRALRAQKRSGAFLPVSADDQDGVRFLQQGWKREDPGSAGKPVFGLISGHASIVSGSVCLKQHQQVPIAVLFRPLSFLSNPFVGNDSMRIG